MVNVAIQIDHLSKTYRIGKHLAHATIREAITGAMSGPFRLVKHLQKKDWGGKPNKILALDDVSFEVEYGEIVGIIGPNGAGKSTILKILSRITEPTRGRATIYGRVGSLLEVGVGFHPELTGRENIYLNGAILGMKRSEIKRKFDEIVDFSEIEKFLDTPVKKYSSGMYVRLAFSVAAHLDPEILIIDEVLAVGDIFFQKKCFRKMQDVGKGGRTVLFVSHNMSAISRLCNRAILLDEGKIKDDGLPQNIISEYLNSNTKITGERLWTNVHSQPGGDVVRLNAIRIRDEEGHVTNMIDIHEPVQIEMEYEVIENGYQLLPNFQFYNEEGIHIFSANDIDLEWRERKRPKGQYVSTVIIPGNLLSDGTLFVGAGLETVNPSIFQFYEHYTVAFKVTDTLEEKSARGDYSGKMGGVIRPILQWKTIYRSNTVKKISGVEQ